MSICGYNLKKTEFLLRKWQYFLKEANKLSEGEQVKKQILIESLATLNEQELHFLEGKYLYTKKKNFDSDLKVAEKYGMTYSDFHKKKRIIEEKLTNTIILSLNKKNHIHFYYDK